MGAGPTRTCVGCRRKRPQAELIRVVRIGEGIEVEPATPRGRGAYVCFDEACVDRALKGGLRRALRLGERQPADLGDRLRARIAKDKEGRDGQTQG